MPRKTTKTTDTDKGKRQHAAEIEGGVMIRPVPLTRGEQVTITYDGLLSYAGADQVYLHSGFGSNQNWQQVYDHKMVRTARGWETTFEITDGSRLNFCFKDSANNWDNNYGKNWSYEIHEGDL